MSHESLQVITRAIDNHIELSKFVEVCSIGFQFAVQAQQDLENALRAAKVLRKSSPLEDPEVYSRELKDARKLERFAKNEMSNGNPFLLGTAVIRQWTIVEAAFDDTIISFLKTPALITNDGDLRKLKGPILELMDNPEDAAHYLLSALKSSYSFKTVVEEFQFLLSKVGLELSVPKPIELGIIELLKVRNNLVHRDGIVDSVFIKSCPWFECQKGKKLPLTFTHFKVYRQAVSWLLCELDTLLETKFDSDYENEDVKEAQAEALTGVQTTQKEINKQQGNSK
jgi:hypothetical protein